jgi:hypothetical protein
VWSSVWDFREVRSKAPYERRLDARRGRGRMALDSLADYVMRLTRAGMRTLDSYRSRTEIAVHHARLTGVNDEHRTTCPTQQERRSKAGEATAYDDDIGVGGESTGGLVMRGIIGP